MSAPAQPPSPVDYGLLDFAMPEPSAPRERPSLSDLSLINSDELAEKSPAAPPAPSGEPVVEPEDEPSIGGDLTLIMPDAADTEAAEPPAADDVPLMDLSLPAPGEAMASITGTPAAASPTIDFLELDDDAMPERGNEDVVDPSIEQPVDESQFVTTPTPAAAPRPSTIQAERSVEMLRRASTRRRTITQGAGSSPRRCSRRVDRRGAARARERR